MKEITFSNVKAKNIVTGEEREIPAITGRNYDKEIADVNSRIDELELFKFPNVTIIGTPTINHGQISDFSATSYLKFPFLVDFHSRPFEIKMSFTTGTNVTNQENIFDSDFGLAFAIRQNRFVIAVSTNGTNWDLGEGVGTHTVLPSTTYYASLKWDLSNYYLSYSLDGVNYTNDITKAGTAQPYPKQIFIGVGENFATVVNHFTGTINLNHATLQIGDEIVWSGMDDAGLSTRADISLSNIDAAGEQRIKDIAGGGDGFVIATYNSSDKTFTVNDEKISFSDWGNWVTSHPNHTLLYNGYYYNLQNPPTSYAINYIRVYDGAYNGNYGEVISWTPFGSNFFTKGLTNLVVAQNSAINSRDSSAPRLISPANLDYAVKQSMCDGRGAEWTDDEKAMAQRRMGILSSEGVGF